MRSLATALMIVAFPAAAQKAPPPIIDMHLHAFAADANGPPPRAICPGLGEFPVWNQVDSWPVTLTSFLQKPPCADPIWGAKTDDEVMAQSIEILKRRNVIAVTSGPLLQRWTSVGGHRIIPALTFGPKDLSSLRPDQMRQWFKEGRYRVFAEVTIQFGGLSPDDPSFEPYVAVAEEVNVPMGIHIGTGPRGAPYLPFAPNYRARLHSPLLLEEVLVRHPKLRVYIMHAGWPMLDDLLAVMWTHPQVHVDIGLISFVLPRREFHRYLQRIVEAGFGKRVMFGSDQMNWPRAIEYAIDSIESAPFLTPEQKRDILYNNAARFLRLTDQDIARHHGR